MNDSKHTTGKNVGKEADNDADPNSISIEKALQGILSAVPPITELEVLELNSVPSTVLGRVLGKDITAPINVPSFRASAMDGYAYRHSEGVNRLGVSAKSFAGHPSTDTAKENECHRITTGARVPAFADTVVQQENVEIDNGFITITKQPPAGHHVRAIGSNSAHGDLLMEKGQRLGAAQIASLSAHGIQQVHVIRKLKVAIFSTGDELLDNNAVNHVDDMNKVLDQGNIFDANRALLANMLSDPAIDVHDAGIARDSIDALTKTFEQCAGADLILSSGGVSVGDADFVRPVLEKNGQLHIWKIAIKPGRPLTFGMLAAQQPYFGLPGNPVSAAVTTLVFVKPAIKKMLGETQLNLPRINATMITPVKKLPGRVEYQRGVLTKNENGDWQVSTTGLQDSHVVMSLHKANCFIELGFDSRGADAGNQVAVIPFAHFGEHTL